jgi:L-aspartate oxidase
MYKYDKRGSLAPRDIVARAIDNEMKIHGDEFVYLDCRHIDKNELIKHFPNIYKKCLSIGIDITRDLIPVAPAAHYICGGIKVDKKGRSSIKNLYAVGECACTGLHGANRLASNSLLEAVVFAHHAAKDAVSVVKNQKWIDENLIPDWDAAGTAAPEEMVLLTQSLKEVQNIMTNYVGIVRSEIRLKRALDRLKIIFNENEALYDKTTISQKLCELRNIIQVAYLVIKHARNRKESRGLHYMIDYPKPTK